MNTKINTVEQTPKLKPDFSHRLSILGDEPKAYLLADTIDTMTHQAESILYLVGCHLVSENAEVRLSNETICNSIDSVIQIINDIRATVDAYNETQKPSGQ